LTHYFNNYHNETNLFIKSIQYRLRQGKEILVPCACFICLSSRFPCNIHLYLQVACNFQFFYMWFSL